MRLLHTSDWHLGHELASFDRRYEHEAFLSFLEEKLVSEAVDVLLVTGDIFDVQSPPASAQQLLYRFLVGIHLRLPKLRTVILGGNHDSPARLEVPSPFADPLGITVVGALPRDAHGEIDLSRALVLLPTAEAPECVLLAIPFLRTLDLPTTEESEEHPTPYGVRRIYEDAVAKAREAYPSLPLLAAGHLYLADVKPADLSEETERPVLGGHQHAVPASIFPSDVAYVALGHLHKPQKVAGRENVRYAGSPIPLSFTERAYKHSFVLFEWNKKGDSLGESGGEITLVPIPRVVPFVSVPSKKAQLGLGTGSSEGTLEQVLAELRALPNVAHLPQEQRSFLTVTVVLKRPDVGLKDEIRKIVLPKGYRIVAIVENAGTLREDDIVLPKVGARKAPTPLELLKEALEKKGFDGEDKELISLFEEAVQSVLEADGTRAGRP